MMQCAALLTLPISKQQSSDWQKLADMPEAEFEAGLAEATKPTTRGLIDPPRATSVGDKALWLWSTLCDFHRMEIIPGSPDDCLSTMTESMIEDVLRLSPTGRRVDFNNSECAHGTPKHQRRSQDLKSDLEIAEIMGARASLIMVEKRVQNIAVPKLHAAIEAACHVAEEYIEPRQ